MPPMPFCSLPLNSIGKRVEEVKRQDDDEQSDDQGGEDQGSGCCDQHRDCTFHAPSRQLAADRLDR